MVKPDSGSMCVSLFSTTDWLRLPIAATLLNDWFSTGFVSTSGRAISGSGLDASPDLSAYTSVHTTILGGSLGLWAKENPGGFGTGNHFRSAYIRFRWSSPGPGGQRSSPRCWVTRSLGVTGQPWFSIWKSANFNFELSHTRTVVRECCKGDDASQWENGKFDPLPPQTP